MKVHSVIGDHYVEDEKSRLVRRDGHEESSARTLFLPLDSGVSGINPEIHLEQPSPGILIYRLSEGFNYLNADHVLETMVQDIHQRTRRTISTSFVRAGDCAWNEFTEPELIKERTSQSNRPLLKAIILDFSAVNTVDVTVSQQISSSLVAMLITICYII